MNGLFTLAGICTEVCATVVGGLLLAIVLFAINEYVIGLPNISGEWKAEINIRNTSYNPFRDLKINYTIHLLQKGLNIKGYGEKIMDVHPSGNQTVFETEKRVLIDIEGYFYRRYLGASTVTLQIKEFGTKRKTISTYQLKFRNDRLLVGKFVSTAANSQGEVVIQRDDKNI